MRRVPSLHNWRGGGAPADSLIRRYHEDRSRGEDWLQACVTEQILRKIGDESVGLVGFKLWAGGGIRRAIGIAEAIRAAYPEVGLLAGGPAVQYCEHHLLELTRAFDALVPGDGEAAVVTAARRRPGEPWPKHDGWLLTSELLSGSSDKGRTLQDAASSACDSPRKSLAPRLNDLPFPRYDVDLYVDIGDFYKLRILDESRGCFNRCAFCSHPRFNGHGTRKRQAAAVVDEMQRLQQEEGTSYFRLAGSNPPADHVLDIASEITRRGLKVYYSAYISLNNAQPDAFATLRESGLVSAFIGVESGDPTLLRRAYNKNNRSRDHVVEVCRAAMGNDIFSTLSFIMPGPFETEATKQASLDLIADIFAGHSHGSVIVLPPLLMPGTRWWRDMARFGFEFSQGLDRKSYMVRGVQLVADYLLPRETWADYGYRLNGKTMADMLSETEQFVREVARLGIVTHLDDASYMLARMGGLEPNVFKARALQGLLMGGADELTAQVHEINGATERLMN